MAKFVIIPDSFKGTLSSHEVCTLVADSIRRFQPDASILKVPVADGGEGSVDAFLQAVEGQKVKVQVTGPLFDQVSAFYGLIDQGQTAVIEMAACAGLPLVGNHRNPSITTTFGVGELILHAAKQGVKKIILGLGGSATNDAGVGCMAALGVRFYNQEQQSFIPVGGTLKDITSIDMSSLNPLIRSIEFITMCDIDNPLYGTNGAAYIFGPQKGASPEMVASLDDHLRAFSQTVERDIGFSQWNFPGAGSAGGMGYGTKVFLNATIQMGIETVLNLIHFDEMIQDADYIFTGEGQLDSQSLQGKVVIGVARRALNSHAKVIALVGNLALNRERLSHENVDEIIVTNYLNLPFDQAKTRAAEDMRYVMDQWCQYHLS